jgi:hypothetical protein
MQKSAGHGVQDSKLPGDGCHRRPDLSGSPNFHYPFLHMRIKIILAVRLQHQFTVYPMISNVLSGAAKQGNFPIGKSSNGGGLLLSWLQLNAAFFVYFHTFVALLMFDIPAALRVSFEIFNETYSKRRHTDEFQMRMEILH